MSKNKEGYGSTCYKYEIETRYGTRKLYSKCPVRIVLNGTGEKLTEFVNDYNSKLNDSNQKSLQQKKGPLQRVIKVLKDESALQTNGGGLEDE